MSKTKSIGIRMSQKLYDALKKKSMIMEAPVTEVVERALISFFDNPKASLKRISTTGILSYDDLLFICELMQRAYNRYSEYQATSKWVHNIVSAFSILLPHLSPSAVKELTPYFISTFPGRGDLQIRITEALELLGAEKSINCQYADMVSRCFQVIVRDGELDLLDDLFIELKSLFEPWCFWVSKKAISSSHYSRIIDTTVLNNKIPENREHNLFLKENGIVLQVVLPHEQSSYFGLQKYYNFSCVYNFIGKASLQLDAVSFYDLLECLEEAGSGADTVFSVGSITLFISYESPAIQKSGIKILLTKDEYDTFCSLTKELFSREDVKADLAKEYVRDYGAL